MPEYRPPAPSPTSEDASSPTAAAHFDAGEGLGHPVRPLMPVDVRSKLHATHFTGQEEGHPAWERAYQRRKALLLRQAALVSLLRGLGSYRAELPELDRRARLSHMLRASLVVDFGLLADQLESRVPTEDMLLQLGAWLAEEFDLSPEEAAALTAGLEEEGGS